MYNTFVLTLNEENINISLLFELKKIFLSYPGDEKVCLKIIEKELMDIIFESNEGAGGYFSYTNDRGETFESTCDMEDNLTS